MMNGFTIGEKQADAIFIGKIETNSRSTVPVDIWEKAKINILVGKFGRNQ